MSACRVAYGDLCPGTYTYCHVFTYCDVLSIGQPWPDCHSDFSTGDCGGRETNAYFCALCDPDLAAYGCVR